MTSFDRDERGNPILRSSPEPMGSEDAPGHPDDCPGCDMSDLVVVDLGEEPLSA